MATYIQGQTDQIPIVQPWTPDYGMMQKALSTMQSRYDQGFASVKNLHNSVLNAPLSNTENKLARDAFSKAAVDQLKELTSADLSDDANVQKAEDAFAPFWQDNEMLYDMSMTKYNKDQWSTMESSEISTDEKMRAQYNPIVAQDLANAQEQLTNARRGDGSIFKAEKRNFVPWTDMTKYLDDEIAKGKVEWKWTEAGNGYVVDTIGGKRFEKSIEEWTRSKMNPQFEQQFKIEARVARESTMKELRATNPGASEGDLRKQMAGMVVTEYVNTAKRQKDALTAELSTTKQSIENILDWSRKNNNGLISPLHKEKLDALYARQDNLEKNELPQTEKSLTAFQDPTSEQVSSIYNQITQSPETYYYSTIRIRRIHSYAAGVASVEQRKITKDETWGTIYHEAQENHRKSLDLQTEMVKQQAANAFKDANGNGVLDSKYENGGAGSGVAGANGTGSGTGSAASGSLGSDKGHYRGASIETPSNTDAPTIFRAAKQQAYESSYESKLKGIETFFSHTNGIADVADYTTIRDFVKDMRGWVKSPFDKTIRRGENFDKVTGFLKSQKLVDDSTGPWGVMTALERYVSDQMKSQVENGTLDQATALEIGTDFLLSEDQKAEFDKMDSAEKAVTKAVISGKNGEKFRAIVDEHNNFVDEEGYVARKYQKPLTITATDGTQIRLNTSDVVHLRNSGQIQDAKTKTSKHYIEHGMSTTSTGLTFTYNGKQFSLSNDDTRHLDHSDFIRAFNGGYKQEYDKLKDELMNMSTPEIKTFQSKTGKVGHVVEFDDVSTDKIEASDKLASEILLPSNNTGRILNFDADDDDAAKLLEYVKTNHADLVKNVNYRTIIKGGGRSLVLTLDKTKFVDNGKKLPGLDVDEDVINKAATEGIELQLSDVASGEAINKLPRPHEFVAYKKLYDGGIISAPPILKSMGYDYNIQATSDGQRARISLTRKVPSKTEPNKYDTLPAETYYMDLAGDYAQLPQQIVGYLNQGFLMQAKQNQQAVNGWKNMPAQQEQGISIDDYNKARQANAVGN